MKPRNELLREYVYVIEGFRTTKSQIIVSVYSEKKERVIKKVDFWEWVVEKGYNTYTLDLYNPKEFDGHEQKTGEIEIDDYFSNSPEKEIMMDIYEYLIDKEQVV